MRVWLGGGGGEGRNAVIISYYLVLKYVLFNFRKLKCSVCHGVCMLSATFQWRGVRCVSWCLYAFSHHPVKGCPLCIMVCVCMLSATTQWRGVSCVSWCVCMLSATTQWRGVLCIMVCVYAFSHHPVKGVSVWCHGVCLYAFSHHPVKGVSVWYHGVCLYAFSHHPVKGVSVWYHGVCLYAFSHHPVKGCQFGIMVSVCTLSATTQWRGVSLVSWCLSVRFQPPPSEGGVILVSWCLSVCFQPPPRGVSLVSWCLYAFGVCMLSATTQWRGVSLVSWCVCMLSATTQWRGCHFGVMVSVCMLSATTQWRGCQFGVRGAAMEDTLLTYRNGWPPTYFVQLAAVTSVSTLECTSLTCHCCCGQSSVHNQGTESFSWKCVYCNLVRRWTLCLKVWQFGNSCLPHRTEGLALWYLCTSAYHTEPKVIVW